MGLGRKPIWESTCLTSTRTYILFLEFKEKRRGMMACICNLSMGEEETEGSPDQTLASQASLLSEFQTLSQPPKT